MTTTYFRRSSFWIVTLLSVLSTLLIQVDATAQPSGARGDDFIYRVVQNDTLINLSSRFTGTDSNWQLLQSLNQVADPYALQIGREIRIPFALIPEIEADGVITHRVGPTLINGRAPQVNATVREGDFVETQEAGFITLALPDGSIATVPPRTTVRIQRLRTFQGTGIIDAILTLDQGDLESYVAPEGQGVGRYEVRTPVSITGVRGTRLRVRSGHHGTQTEVLSGAAQLGTQDADGPRLRAQQGTAVNQDGTILGVRPLLPAPTLRPDADSLRQRTLAFDPVPGAVAYQVRVAADEAGTQAVWTDTVNQTLVRYRTPGGGHWFVLVRAIDELGLMSDDARLQVEGGRVLISGSGTDVMTHFGEPVRLTDY